MDPAANGLQDPWEVRTNLHFVTRPPFDGSGHTISTMHTCLSPAELIVLGLVGTLAALLLVSLLDTLGLARTFTRMIGGGGYVLSEQYERCRKDMILPAPIAQSGAETGKSPVNGGGNGRAVCLEI